MENKPIDQLTVQSHQNSFEYAYLRTPSAKLILQGKIFDNIDDFYILYPDFFTQLNRFYYHQFNRNIYNSLGISHADQILSIGCLFGYDEKNLYNLYKDFGVRLFGIDISKAGIYVAQKNNPVAVYAVAVAEKLPFKNNSLNKIYSREVIEHVIKPELMLAEIHRVLKKNGLAIITTPNADSFCSTHLVEKLNKFLGTHIWESQHDFKDEHMSVKKMKSLLGQFKIEKIIFDGNFYFLLNSLHSEKRALFFAKFTRFVSFLPLINQMFCDQVKYVIRKTNGEDYDNNSCLIEPETLFELDEKMYCHKSGKSYFDSQLNTANFINPESCFDFNHIEPLNDKDKHIFKRKYQMNGFKTFIWFSGLTVFYFLAFILVLPFSFLMLFLKRKS